MIVIIGGAYQGKLDYAKQNFNIEESDVAFCQGDSIPDFSKKVIYNFQNYIKYLVSNNLDCGILEIDKFVNKIIICDDISCGIVPIDFSERKYREETGKALQKLCAASDRVIRIFCGIGTVIK